MNYGSRDLFSFQCLMIGVPFDWRAIIVSACCSENNVVKK